MDLLSLLSVLVLCAKILSYVCYTLMSIDISIFICLFTFYFMTVYVSLYYHCVLTVILIKKLLTYLLSIEEIIRKIKEIIGYQLIYSRQVNTFLRAANGRRFSGVQTESLDVGRIKIYKTIRNRNSLRSLL